MLLYCTKNRLLDHRSSDKNKYTFNKRNQIFVFKCDEFYVKCMCNIEGNKI